MRTIDAECFALAISATFSVSGDLMVHVLASSIITSIADTSDADVIEQRAKQKSRRAETRLVTTSRTHVFAL